MKLRRFLFFAFILITIFGSGYYLINNYFSNKQANLEVKSNSSDDIFVDGINKGKAPLDLKLDAKEVTVKVNTFETRVILQKGIKTIINRDFDGDRNFGEILSFEKIGTVNGILTVISNPTPANVNVDGQSFGETPLSIDNLKEGTHKINISLDGYQTRELTINIYKGYRLTAIFDLASSMRPEKATQVTQTQLTQETFVKILQTPNGFLRVRKEPNTTSDEIARVHEGDIYLLKSTDKKTGWFDIMLDASSSGWISDIYAATTSSNVKE